MPFKNVISVKMIEEWAPVRQAVRFAVALALAAQLSAPALGQNRIDNLDFSLSVGGFRVASLNIRGEVSERSYKIAAVLTSTGIVNWFTNIRYDGRVEGTTRRGNLVPRHYVETTSRDGSQASGSITYRNGVPVRIEKSPPDILGTPRASISKQRGTLDLLTMSYLALRDVELGEICDKSFSLYDGTRRSEVVLGEPVAFGDGFRCDCKIVRVDGYSESAMAEQPELPFELEFRPVEDRDDWYAVKRLKAPTDYGRLVATRR